MQKHRFEVRLADVDRMNLDAVLVGFGHHRGEDVFRLVRNHRHLVIGGVRFEDILHAFE